MKRLPELTKEEFETQCRELGFREIDACFFDLGIPGKRAVACTYNERHSYRLMLECLIREKHRLERIYAKHARR